MLNKIIHYSLHNRLVVLCAAILLLIAGTYTAMHTEVDVFPDLNAPTVVIMTEANGMAAEEVEQLVTFPVETAVNGATGVVRLGNGYLSCPPDCERKTGGSQRIAACQRRQTDSRPTIFYLGRDAYRRADCRFDFDA